MFPEALCNSLAQLHNQSPAHGWAHTEKVMESSLGLPRKTLLQVFDEFSREPIASGSIAQVHKARIRGTTQPLAIKVRHPKVARLLDMDFRIMEMVATVADLFPGLSWLHVRDTVEQFSSTMAAQAHLNVEGHHLEILNYNFRGWSHVVFPKPIYASSSVIIETFESGRIVSSVLDDYDAIAEDEKERQGGPIVEEVEDEDGDDDEEENDDDMDHLDIEYGFGHEVIPVPLAKFLMTTGLAVYLKMLLIDNLMVSQTLLLWLILLVFYCCRCGYTCHYWLRTRCRDFWSVMVWLVNIWCSQLFLCFVLASTPTFILATS